MLHGLGLKEQLADEITGDLRAIRMQAIAEAIIHDRTVTKRLTNSRSLYKQTFARFEDPVPVLKRLGKEQLHLAGVAVSPVAVLQSLNVCVAMLGQNVVRLQFVDEDHRAVDVHVVLGG
jgi:hypothetical protein